MTSDRSIQIDSFEAYQAFLLIHAAHDDIQFTSSEKEMISKEFGKVTMEKMTKLYYSMNDFQALELIKSLKPVFINTKLQEQQLRAKIVSIFEVDGDFSRPEKAFLNFLDHYLGLSDK